MPPHLFASHHSSPKMRTSAPGRWAIVRVTIETSGDDPGVFVVSIKPRQCPKAFFREEAEGTVSIDILKKLDEDFSGDPSEHVGSSEPNVLHSANDQIRDHAQKLAQFLWDSVAGYDKLWWSGLGTSTEVDFLAIELLLCKELRKYVWEALLTLAEFPGAKTAIIRAVQDETPRLNRHQRTTPLRLVLRSRQMADLPELGAAARRCMEDLKKHGWIEVTAPGGVGELDALTEIANKHERVILVYIGHGHKNEQNGQGELEVDRGDGQEDWVGPDGFFCALPHVKHLTLVLIACGVGFNEAIDGWLGRADVVVAMQLPLSKDAAATFVEELLADDPDPPDLDSPSGVVQQVARGRADLARRYYRVETATPVIYSRDPLEIARPWARRAAVLTIGLLGLVALVAYLLAPWLPPCTAVMLPAFTVNATPVPAAGTYTVSLSNGEMPDLVIKADIAAKPPWCRSRPATGWAVIGEDGGARQLPDLDGFLTIPVQAPPAGEEMVLRLHVRDEMSLDDTYTYVVFRTKE
jgi:hypothetical protein